MTLTNREKLLLFVLGIVALVIVSVMMVILPMTQEIDALKLEKQDLEMRKTIIDTTLPQLPGLKIQQDTKKTSLNEELGMIQSPLTGAEFERWMLPLTTKYDMQIVENTISERVVTEPNGNIVIVNEPIYGLRTMIQGFTGEDVDVDTAPVSSESLLKMTVKYNVITNYPRYKSLLHDIARWNTTFYVVDSSYSFTTGEASVTIDAYMVHKLDYTGDRAYTGDYHASGDNDTGGDPRFIDDIYYK